MPQTFRATDEGDHIRWHDAAHPDSREKPVEVQVVVLDEPAVLDESSIRTRRVHGN
ncbi:MAG TPA: hypothetical protein VEO95_10985 [Chthoniobacteraceae bacterium]|nr:hypothetical protein [Chthoniobacteraceae bacterium]